ncbi:MAG: type II secretion system protein [Candidatus Omnitrophica bacterium]|nr:type II secretion system protein [Candidatus Omnitrophota bacterium]
MSRKNGFTLIEIIVSLAVFAVVMAVMGSEFFNISKDWQRQRDYNLVLDNARWAMEFMSNEIRKGHADNNVTIVGEGTLSDHELLTFSVDPTKGPKNKKIYYWRGKSGYGEPYILYRGEVKWNKNLGDAVNVRQELSRFVVDGTDIFNVSAGCAASPTTNCTVEVNLTVRPKPDQPVFPGNQNYTFRTLVRPRN